MLAKPEFEPEFYNEQIEMMSKRYSILFSNWKLSWKKYIEYVSKSLRNNPYWIWVYLCGFEKFVQEQSSEPENRRKRLYKDADSRIARIISDTYKVEEYIRSL